jgi:hypothetical protein
MKIRQVYIFIPQLLQNVRPGPLVGVTGKNKTFGTYASIFWRKTWHLEVT